MTSSRLSNDSAFSFHRWTWWGPREQVMSSRPHWFGVETLAFQVPCLPVPSSFPLGKNLPRILPHSGWEAKLSPFTEGKLTEGYYVESPYFADSTDYMQVIPTSMMKTIVHPLFRILPKACRLLKGALFSLGLMGGIPSVPALHSFRTLFLPQSWMLPKQYNCHYGSSPPIA